MNYQTENKKMNKYKLTKETKIINCVTVHRIEALKDFGNVKKGDLGGYIENGKNLSQKGNAWVYGDAKVSGNAWVYGDAKVSGDAWVYGDAEVCGGEVYGDAEVCGDEVSGDAEVSEIITLNGKRYKLIKENK
jgi:hypothetical protein